MDSSTQNRWDDGPLAGERASIPGTDASKNYNTNQRLAIPSTPSHVRTSPIQYINEDVFALIAVELSQPGPYRGSLSRLSLTCRRLRSLSMPVLFSRCAVLGGRGNLTTGIPPLVIRPYARHLTYNWSLYHAQYAENYQTNTTIEFGIALSYLPHVRSVTFAWTEYGVQWAGIERCLNFPQIKSISFTGDARFKCIPPYPNDNGPTSSVLEELCYPTPTSTVISIFMKKMVTLPDMLALERSCLSTLLLAMHSTARSLVLPMRTTSFRIMATVDWPALQDLFLGGSFPNNTGDWLAKRLRSTLRRMPNLRHLVIVAALPRHVETRCCLLSRDPSSSPWQHSLRSLVVAYPDHRDPVFSVPFSALTYLSLRDWPRHYQKRGPWRSPILSATQALSILRRLRTPGLTTLELVYRADEADDELLAFIPRAFAKLRHLELHRYRRSTDEVVDHCHIAHILSAAPSLLRLRLHLDFTDDPGEYIDHLGTVSDEERDYDRYEKWRIQLAHLGWDVLDAMDACSSLEGVALLDRVWQKAAWVWFLRGRRKDPRAPVRDFSDGNCDILPSALPAKMGGRLMAY